MSLTMGSLFDGIGGFPLAASHVGIKTLWASEIEPFPIKVTMERFPEMVHVGDNHQTERRGSAACRYHLWRLTVSKLVSSGKQKWFERFAVRPVLRDDTSDKGAEKCGQKKRKDSSVCSPKMVCLGERAWRIFQRGTARRGFPHRPGILCRNWLRCRFYPST